MQENYSSPTLNLLYIATASTTSILDEVKYDYGTSNKEEDESSNKPNSTINIESEVNIL